MWLLSRVSAHGVMDQSFMVHPLSYFTLSLCSITGVTKTVVCAILSVGVVRIKYH